MTQSLLGTKSISEAILDLLSDGREHTWSDILDNARKYYIHRDKSWGQTFIKTRVSVEIHRLMNKRGLIERVRRGVYKKR